MKALYLYWPGGGNTKVWLNECVNMHTCGPELIGEPISVTYSS